MRWAPAVLISALWLDLFIILQPEWELNAQYSYGYLVPFIGLYLWYLRWQDRPSASPVGKGAQTLLWTATLAGLLLLLPIRMINEANPDWRLAYWAQGSVVFAISIMITYLLGGRRWMLHFLLPIIMLMFCIPWPSIIEQPLVQNLMRMVAAITVDVVNLCGIQAVREGNLIHMANMPIGVEEACSGIRSLQSTIMAGFFFGELYRFPALWRITLLALGIPMAVFLNLMRTLSLTYAAYSGGEEKLDAWHDVAGDVASVAGFMLLMGLAFLIRRFILGVKDDEPLPPASQETPFALPAKALGLCGALWVGSFLANEAWYALHNTDSDTQYTIDVNWDAAHHEITFEEIDEATEAILRYSEGKHAVWFDAHKAKWTTYYFIWEPGTISSFAGVHRPDVCLPAAGFEFDGMLDSLTWESPEGLVIVFKTYVFKNAHGKTYVFFAVWDDAASNTEPELASTSIERIEQAIQGKRVGRRRQLEFIVQGAQDYERVRDAVTRFMQTTIDVTKTNKP